MIRSTSTVTEIACVFTKAIGNGLGLQYREQYLPARMVPILLQGSEVPPGLGLNDVQDTSDFVQLHMIV
jgi:hypothetical protein